MGTSTSLTVSIPSCVFRWLLLLLALIAGFRAGEDRVQVDSGSGPDCATNTGYASHLLTFLFPSPRFPPPPPRMCVCQFATFNYLTATLPRPAKDN
jgi:hypothetical protein